MLIQLLQLRMADTKRTEPVGARAPTRAECLTDILKRGLTTPLKSGSELH